MTFEELGALLRSEREKRHLSIEDVANQLKISPRLIRALEDGDEQGLPHPAYARGFIRSYARLLGIGNDEVQVWFSELQQGESRPTKPANAQHGGDNYITPPPPRKARKGIWAFLILCIISAGAYWAWDSGKIPINQLKREKPVDIVKSLPSADTYQASRPAPPPTPPVAISAPEPSPVAAPAQPAEPEPIPEPIAAPEPTQEQPPEQHKLIIIATEECWVHSNADRTDTRQFSLRKGDTFALTFAKNLELKLGNAGGVRLRYDGADLPPAGTSGQVRTLTFPPKDS